MAMDFLGLSVGMGYTDETVLGGGALKGENCVVSNIEEVADGVNVTFQSILDDGTVKTDTAFIPRGTQGEAGVAGKSAYEIWLEAGNTGTEEDFLISLVGEKGADGTMTFEDLTEEQKASLKGEQGEQGEQGEKGDDGKSAYQYAQDGGYIGTETEFTTNIARSGVISKELEVERARIDNLTTLQDGSTTGDAELIDGRIDFNGKSWGNIGEHIRGITEELHDEINNIENVINVYGNMVNPNEGTTGQYYSSQYLNTMENAGYCTFPLIALEANKIYTIRGIKTGFTWIQRNGLSNVNFDAFLNDVEYTTNSDNSITFKTPDNIVGIYITCGFNDFSTCMLDANNKLFENYVPYGKEIVNIPNLKNNGKIINDLYVNKAYTPSNEGYGITHFSSIVSAVNSIKDSNQYNEYNIYIDSGEYFIFEEMGGADYISSISTSNGERQGLVLPDYVNLIGTGKVVLNGVVADNISTIASTTCISPLNMWGHNKIENIDIIAQNTRYCIHCESNNAYYKSEIVIENCHCVHLGNNVENGWFSTQAFGGGSGSGAKFIVKNSSFKSSQSQGFSLHTNFNQKSNIVDIDGCYFIGADVNSGIVFSTYGDNTEPCKLYYKNSISTPNALAVWKSDTYGNVWDIYDYVSNTITMHNEL